MVGLIRKELNVVKRIILSRGKGSRWGSGGEQFEGRQETPARLFLRAGDATGCLATADYFVGSQVVLQSRFPLPWYRPSGRSAGRESTRLGTQERPTVLHFLLRRNIASSRSVF